MYAILFDLFFYFVLVSKKSVQLVLLGLITAQEKSVTIKPAVESIMLLC